VAARQSGPEGGAIYRWLRAANFAFQHLAPLRVRIGLYLNSINEPILSVSNRKEVRIA